MIRKLKNNEIKALHEMFKKYDSLPPGWISEHIPASGIFLKNADQDMMEIITEVNSVGFKPEDFLEQTHRFYTRRAWATFLERGI